MQSLFKLVSKLLISVATCVSFAAWAAPVTTFTFEFTSNAGTVFARSFSLEDFSGTPQFFDFGSGSGMWKAQVSTAAPITPSPRASQMAAVFAAMPLPGLAQAQSNVTLFGELAYYVPGGTPATANGQLRVESSTVAMRETGSGDWFYDNYYFSFGTSASRPLEDLTPQSVADWFNDAGSMRWTEYASRDRCETSTQGPCTYEGRFQWGGTARLVSAVTVDPLEVPEPGSLALLGLGLVGLVAARKRKQA